MWIIIQALDLPVKTHIAKHPIKLLGLMILCLWQILLC